jgi:UDP-N-acetylglucosamine 2-epimerase (non-hydrolysing)/GDP/UDP-N,N'-diacetylbacillosamine 2-epimerase (hydrolysing)
VSRRIFVVVERRADYSRYRPILERMRADPAFEIHLVVTGICLLARHGRDVDHIRADGMPVAAEIPMFDEDAEDTPAEMVRALARFLGPVTDELERARPDLVLSGFDIGANLAVTIAAAHMNIPVAHIQGGEVTGSIDESIRHAMTKFAHLHFPATERARERLLRMGEAAEHIFVIGCPSLDVLLETPDIPTAVLGRELGIDFSRPVVLMIQHPVTTEPGLAAGQIRATLDAVKAVGEQAVVMLPNNDAGHAAIVDAVRRAGLKWFPSLPTPTFVNLFRRASVLVGNSSAGIHETASLRIPTVNVGSRQQGRERAANVIDVPHDRAAIETALRTALYDSAWRARLPTLENPYGDGTASRRIVEILRTVPLDGLVQKRFRDDPFLVPIGAGE